jgi:hypothetical protein
MRPGLFLPIILFLLAAWPVQADVVDTGFRPDPHGFGFPNAGDPEVLLGIDVNALLGTDFHDEILRHTGHCYGMCVAAVKAFERNGTSIGCAPADAMPAIDRIQTGQSFYYIAGCFWPPYSGGRDNFAEYRRLRERLSSGRPAVLGVYPSARTHPGHAVVAYMVERRNGVARIYVYDPNLPATLHDYGASPMVAVFDEADGSFRYDNGKQFDDLRVDEVDGDGVARGQAIVAGLLALPGIMAALLIGLPLSPRRP